MLATLNNYRNSILQTLYTLHRWLMRQLFNQDSLLDYLEPILQQLNPHWRHRRHAARVLDITQENDQIVSLKLSPVRAFPLNLFTLATNQNWQQHKAGQYVHLTVVKNGALITRTFSIASAPSEYLAEGTLTLTVRVHEQGGLTPFIQNDLRSGDMVYLSEAQGDFVLQENDHEPKTLKQVFIKKVFIAGGSGLTPIHSMLSNSINQAWFKDATLLFYVQNQHTLFYQAQLNALKSAGLNLRTIFSDSEGFFSINHLDTQTSDFSDTEFYVCGPGKMINLVCDKLQDAGVSADNIHREYFGLAQGQTANFNTEQFEDEAILVDYLDSKKQRSYSPDTFIGEQANTLLELAEQEGLNPVSGCRIGVCHQCLCKKKTGRVFNRKTGLTSDGGEEDIQLCLSVPLGHVELEL